MDIGSISRTNGGKWRQAPLSAPLLVIPGDALEIEKDIVWQKRADHYIDSRSIGTPTDYEPQPFEQQQTITTVLFFEEKPVPAAAVTLTDVTVNQTSGVITAKFSDGTATEFTDFSSLVNAVDEYDTQTDHAKNLLLLALIRRTPDGSNLDSLNGSSCTIDGQAATPVQFSLSE